MKLQSNEFEPRWVLSPNCQVSSKSVNRKWVNGRGHRTTTDKQTSR